MKACRFSPVQSAAGLFAALLLVARAAVAQAPPAEDDNPPPPRNRGSTHFALGVIALLAPPDRTIAMAPGLDLDVHHESGEGNLEMGGSLRFGMSGNADNSSLPAIAFVMLSGGGRYFTSPSAPSWRRTIR